MLSGPDEKDIPHQGSKVFLQENGILSAHLSFARSGVTLMWNLKYVKPLREHYLLMWNMKLSTQSISQLLKLTLAPGQYLTGTIINRVFGNNKLVYVRPSRQVLHSPKKENCQRHDLPINVFEDDDDPDKLATNDNCFELGQGMDLKVKIAF